MLKGAGTQSERMTHAARERLRGVPAEVLARNAGATFSDGVIELRSMDEVYRIRVPEYTFERELGMWHHLTLLQYLYTADGTPLSGEWIPLERMPGGLSRGYGFNKDISLIFERSFGTTSAERFMALCERLGGRAAGGNADASVIVPYAPRFPVRIGFWEGDDEFPCSGKVLVDANAHHYLTIEGAGGACATVVQRLADMVRNVIAGG